MDERSEDVRADRARQPLTDEQLAAFKQGWAATIMPVEDGWKINYFSVSDFEDEPGTTFPSIDEALGALRAILAAVNLPEERERARRALEHPRIP